MDATQVENPLHEPLLASTKAQEPSTQHRSDDFDAGEDDEEVIVDGLPWSLSMLIKSLFFLDALGASTWGRFSAIYYNLHGLNSMQIGLIEGARTIIPTLSMVGWGIVADRFRSQKAVWLITKVVSTVTLLTLALPWVYSSFENIMGVSILSQLFVSNGILDAYTLELLGTVNKIFYGRYRLYASLSWGIGSIIMGWITDHYGFEPNFIMFGLLGGIMVFMVATKIPETAAAAATTENHVEPSAEAGKVMELVRLAIRPRVLCFLIIVVVMGAGMATVERLLFLYLTRDLGASTLLCGLSVGVNVLFELPIFWYADNFMKVLGHDGMFSLAMICFVFRLYGYTMLTPETKWFILPLEVMHGITFAMFWIVSTDISKVLVHQTQGAFWRTAIPSSVQMLYSSLGVSFGSIVGGWAMNRYGSREMYICTANIVGVTLILHFFGSIVSRTFWNGSSFMPDYPHNGEDENENNDEVSNALIDGQEGRSPPVETFESDVEDS